MRRTTSKEDQKPTGARRVSAHRPQRGRDGQRPKNGELLDTLPPSNVQMERELLSALWVHNSGPIPVQPEQAAYAFERLSAKDFYEGVHGFVFEEIKAAWKSGVPYSSKGSLLQWFKQRGALDTLRREYDAGIDWLYEIIGQGFPWHIPYYCTTLRELRKKRAAIALGLELVKRGYQSDVKYETWREYLAKQIERLDSI